MEYYLEILLVVAFGAIFGSFISAASWRLPREENLISESSQCRSCKAKLGAKDLIPVFSWLLSRGKCRHCGAGIGKRYILCELLTIAIFVVNHQIFGLTVEFFVVTTASIGILILIISDFETYIIPDTSQVLLLISGLAHAFLLEKEWQGLAIGAISGLIISLGLRQIFMWVLKKDPLGLGDVKLFAIAGIWIGGLLMPFYLILSGILGTLTGIVWQKVTKKEAFPFGPALAISLYIFIIYYNEISGLLLLK